VTYEKSEIQGDDGSGGSEENCGGGWCKSGSESCG
jgi:hypothetical protein